MATPAPEGVLVHFGVYTADLRSGELRKQGIPVPLQDRPFQILAALLERPGEVVTREELRQRLWPAGVYVDFDHSISSAINKLRNALNDSATHPRYIETVGRHGYRFVYPIRSNPLPPPGPADGVQELSAAIPATNRLRVWVIAGLAAVIVAIAIAGLVQIRRAGAARPVRSIAVLPLRNLSSDPAQEYFSEGLTDELITELASLPGLQVISRTSAMHYKDTRKTLPEIARELHVDAVLEGSVLRSGNRVRIIAELVEGATDRHLWAHSYERDQRDILNLQNEVARDIAENIHLTLEPAERQRLAASRPLNPAVHDLYLRGRYFWNKRTASGLKQATEYFQQAIAEDPEYARAYAGLADSYALMSTWALGIPTELMPKARNAALRALELDERLAEAYTSLALIYESYDYNWDAAEREFHRAIELDPNYATAHHWYAEFLAFQGRFEEASAESDRARRLDPLSLIIASDHGVLLLFSRQYDRAIAQFRAVQAVDPNFPRARMIIPAYVEKGMFGEALAEAEKWRRAEPDNAGVWAMEAGVYGRMGRQNEAWQALRKFQQATRNESIDTLGMLIGAYAAMNNKAKALEHMEKAYRERSNVLTALKVDPNYDRLRSDPRFQDLMRRVGLA